MKTVPFFFFLLIPVLGWGQTFDSVVDFNLELSSLTDPAAVLDAADDGRILILEGLMGDTVTDESGSEAKIWVTLIGGSWIGTTEVRAYSCRILFEGDKWLEVFSGVDTETDASIPSGSRLLMAVRVTGFNNEKGVSEAVMVDYRVLQ